MVNIKVDTNKKIKNIKPMHAVGQPPIDIGLNQLETDMLHYLKEANIPYARMHDVGGTFGKNLFVDVPNLFRDFDADENDPDSYDFIFTDKLFEAMMEYGVEPYFRLGVTIENCHGIKAYRIFPPKDPYKWARVCEHIVRHYNEGWANGYHFNIKYWEIWNEPDGDRAAENNDMWRGTAEQYYDLYAATAKRLKECFGDSIKVGGYGSRGLYLGFMRYHEKYSKPHELASWELNEHYHLAFFRGFVERIKRDNIPLDFFSHHSYLPVIWTEQVQKYCEELFDEYGLNDVEIHINEWNTIKKREDRGSSKIAAESAAMMIAMHRTRLQMLCYYDARFNTSMYAGLFNPLTAEPFCTLYSFAAFGELYRLGDEISVEGDGDGLYALAATNGDEKGILITNIGDTKSVTTNLEEGYTVYKIDSDHHMTPVELDYNCLEIAKYQTLFLKK